MNPPRTGSSEEGGTAETPHPAALDDKLLLAQCDVQRTRRSGTGGQHRNKVESAVVLKYRSTGTIAEAGERRSQHENLRVAVRRLRLNLALEHRLNRAGATSPSLLWKSRCRNGRISISERHDDFPALLAEVLDTVDRFGIDLHDAAEFLGCTRTQLVQFLKIEPRALAEVNQRRTAVGQKRLR